MRMKFLYKTISRKVCDELRSGRVFLPFSAWKGQTFYQVGGGVTEEAVGCQSLKLFQKSLNRAFT
jgi:hypothetical protein